MDFDSDMDPALAAFADDGWITQVLYEVKSGKEATVFCCRGGARSPVPLVAAKVHRPIETRRFRNDAIYTGGRVHLAREGRIKRAVQNNSAFGRAVQFATWLAEEWDVLNVLHDCGVTVPRPLAIGETAILMAYLGDEETPAPMLNEIRPDRALATQLIDQILHEAELMLDLDCVHGDLSPHNIMFDGGRAVIIDFPQAIDPRLNTAGRELLARDLHRVCDWAARHGVHRPADKIARRLWRRFREGGLG